MSYLDWKVGMKVACINDKWDDQRPLYAIAQEAIPTAGAIYTIREIGYLHPKKTDVLCIRLDEVKNPFKRYRYGRKIVETERCFGAYRFRPVQPRKTDISCFTAMLTPSVDA